LSCAGVTPAARPFLAALLRHLFPQRPVVLVTEGLKPQETAHQDLATWLPGPLFYPAWEVLPHEARLPHADVISERLETLVALAGHGAPGGGGPPVVVTSVVALLQRTFAPQTIRDRTRVVSRGDRVDPLDLVEWLEDQGYEPEAQVTQKGDISLRGGILDVYPLTNPWPVRLEFFGDEIDSLRNFDPLTQISREPITSISLPPAGELGLLKKSSALTGAGNIESRATAPLATLLDFLPRNAILLLSDPERLAGRADEYASQVPPGDPLFFAWEDFQRQAADAGLTVLSLDDNLEGTAGEERPDWSDSGPGGGFELAGQSPGEEATEVPPPPVHSSEEGFHPHLSPHSLTLPFEGLDTYRPLVQRMPEPQIAEAERREFFFQLHRWLRQGFSVHVFCNNDGERQRFSELWTEYGLNDSLPAPAPGQASAGSAPSAGREREQCGSERVQPGSAASEPPGAEGLQLRIGVLSRGFIAPEARVVVVTDSEIFGRYRLQRPRRLKSPHAQATRSALDIDFSDLEEGDYVVHLQHGVGRYLGLQVLPIGAGAKPTEGAAASANANQECLVIEYAPNEPGREAPRLYVPVTEAHLVSKYVGTGKARPPLNTLGGTRWAKAKAQAERAVRDVASELLAIQAARESQPGHAFAQDAPWQREFEGAFLFEETPDQMRAILETKADMERPKPMDRLICGDVGFGKTEVGIRAAFKAVMDGRQVAMLVPTTVLAQQHFNTFRERMADYPIRIELLSRFRTRRIQQRVVKDLALGSVDIVIGTHRLLQGDISFKDLGLVVIDEEQRFGVLHKEKFKMLRKMVDVLTLSATPIPRTLYLALSGARDMSTIQTPPHDRLPVETIVTQYDERLIRDAIQRELNRGGQVFFLHNRVLTIHTVANKLRELVPHARIVVGHGQMHSDDLEEVMTQFVNGEADILLSTTIIESGLDIPNANTIIIDRADRFGLSDLYQLRGRVGRYKHQAYAYLLLPRHARLLTDVRKRMSAIKQYSTLGSGFKIAMRDLEIRGAGNLLGAEQSGHITAVGFDLYCQLLKQSVASLKGEKVKPRVEVQIRLDFLALSPAEESPLFRGERSRDSLLGAGADSGMEGFSETGRKPPRAVSPMPVAHPNPQPAAAYIPYNYISDTRQRIEIYRKLAQVDNRDAVTELDREIRDRFGPPPRPLELLLQVTELKAMAAGRNITAIEVKEDKLMLTRNNDYVMVGSKFPRLQKKDPRARLKEIRVLLLAL
jgi:transcription-repair coupling factor (superfamily II helicase)